MIRHDSFFKRLKRGGSLFLAVLLAVQSFFNVGFGIISADASEGENRGSTFAYYGSQNLLKEGASFPFYGKKHNRVGLWPYGITNVEGGHSAPGYCLEPNKSMRSGTPGTIVTYDLDMDGDNLPLGLTREDAEILWYALSSSGNFEGGISGNGKIGQGHYILGQAATWAITSGNWNGLDDFRSQMEVLIENLKDPMLAVLTRGALEQFFKQVNGAVEEGAVPPFASKFQSQAPVHKMKENGDGTYSITLEFDGDDWRQSTLVYDLPEGWNVSLEHGRITFTCTTGNPDIGLVRGHFQDGSLGAQYWVKPNSFKIWYPDGWNESSAVDGKQAMITMAGKQESWEVWLSFGKSTTHRGEGDYEIPYTQYLHEETFKRDYVIELEKQCSETGKTLENSTFEVLEKFEFSQLDGTNLEKDQFMKMVPTSEGKFEDLTVCDVGLCTDANGHFSHSDKKLYKYEKTYCGGHPDPVIHYVDGDSDSADEENERRKKKAWEAWQECVDWCEENCDFHSIDEGVARDLMKEDRDEAWNTYIHLKRIYTVRETDARTGYILHDLHNDDVSIEIVEFSSSQSEGEGAITGYYPGNRAASVREMEDVPQLSKSEKVTDIVQAGMSDEGNQTSDSVTGQEKISEDKGNEQEPAFKEHENTKKHESESSGDTAENGEEGAKEVDAGSEETADTTEIKESEEASQPSMENREETDEDASPEAETQHSGNEAESVEEETITEDLPTVATKSQIGIEKDVATPSNASKYVVSRPASIKVGTGGHWEWDGVQEDSEVAMIEQGSYPSGYIGYAYLVKDHRTEGELHINKRDKELFELEEDSYGKAQADATLEGAVYGLYAAEDIRHPDGKTGVVFSAGELVSIATTDKNGDASFLTITEVSETSREVPNLYTGNEVRNGNGWIGRPLILGSYYIEEISRSEGYERSVTGKNLSESNRTGKPIVLTASGRAYTDGFTHSINEWFEDSYDFTVKYYKTKGFDILLSGLPERVKAYEVTRKETASQEQVITGTERVEKKDAQGNILYRTAEGGEYKLDEIGNKIIKSDDSGNPVLSDRALTQTVSAVNRLNDYISSIEREEPSDLDMEESEDIDEDYILWETSSALALSGYKSGLSDYPFKKLRLSGKTNGKMIDEILTFCSSESFWDAYDVDAVYEEAGTWYARIRYGYKALANQPAIYESGSGLLVIRKEYEGGFYYAVYEDGQYDMDGYRFTVEKKELDLEALGQDEILLKTVYAPVYETYAAGEFILDSEGQKIPQMEAVPIYTSQEVVSYEEILTPVKTTAVEGQVSIHVDTDEEFTEGEKHERTYRVVTEQKITEYTATVNVMTTKPEQESGSYLKFPVLFYPGQYEIYEDNGTRKEPVIMLERVIKQAIEVKKDIALDSYEHNTYEIHRDPFTVLFGGYNGTQETKTLPGFFFKLYLRSDLEKTDKLMKKEDGSYDYVTFFKENPDAASELAIEWDLEKYDSDGDMTTVHANRGGGKDDYWGQSRMLPYGTYVLVEQQPTGIPQKHYAIDAPQEVEIPFVPQIDADGTVHDKIPSKEYLYDSAMTPEELTERYQIRFNEETHIIYAHNNDGDFEVFKYGLEPDSRRDCQNETVAGYYHYGSISEDAGSADQVYYETYYDRDGTIADYGVTMNGVVTMTGKSTAVDRMYAKALVPWSVLDPRFGEVINDDGDIGNREAGLETDGTFNFISFAVKDFENEFYSSRLRIEKLDSETGENILHEGALFKIYAAKRDVNGNGASGVTGSGDILFDEDGTPLYEEREQIFMQDDTGAEVGVFKAYTTIRDGEVEGEDGSLHTEKQCVGYLETYQPLGAGAYVLVEVEAPDGYVKSKPIAFTVYSDKVEYYEDGNQEKKTQAVKYQYMRPIGADGKTVVENTHQIIVKNAPTHIEIHKLENRADAVTYRVEGDEKQLKNRGDVDLQYKPNGEFAGFGYVTKRLENGQEKIYVENATLTLYEGLEVKQTGDHEYEKVKVKRNLFGSVTGIQAYDTGVDTNIRQTGTNAAGQAEWDITEEDNPPVDIWYFDLKYDPTELDEQTGILYGLDDWGNRLCMLNSETGMAYVTDKTGAVIVWPLDENGDKIISQSVEVYTNGEGNSSINMDLQPVPDENGLPIYYKDGGVTWIENEWVTDHGACEIARVRQGAYILEETAAPLSDGYVQSAAVGVIVRDVSEKQSYVMEDDYTKIEVSKLDMTSRKEIEGAVLTLYEAYRVYDDSDRGWHLEILRDMEDKPIVAERWVSEGNVPHWIDHIMPGDYILQETRVPTKAGYVTAEDVEVTILETGEVQSYVMEDDHTAVEVLKLDSRTGAVMDNLHRATLALYEAQVDEKGEVQYTDDGTILYHQEKKVYEWQTDDGSDVRKTAHQVTIPGGHSYTAYDYEIEQVPGTSQAVCYITETGAMRFEYLPVGKYVLVEEQAPYGYTVAAPVYVPVLDVGSKERVQTITMTDEPIQVLLTKVNVTGGKEISGATVAVYRAKEDGTLAKHQMKDKNGNLLYVTDTDGNLLQDEDGNHIPAMEYEEAYLVERWISGSDGIYTKRDQKEGRIPEGNEIGDLRLHELRQPAAGNYYFVEEQSPFGYVRAAELPFAIVDTLEIQKIELVNDLILGQVEIIKTDKRNPEQVLSGARFRLSNLDTNVATILITDSDGRAVSSPVPIGGIGTDGTVSLYHFRIQEVEAPDGYLLDPTVHDFQFNIKTDQYQTLTYQYEAADSPNKVIISKKQLTTKEELPGASLEVRRVTEMVDKDGTVIRIDGDVIESWISTEVPHELECLTEGLYVLIETRAPEGYIEAEKVYFTISGNMTVADIPMVEMFDDDTKIEIRKVDNETGNPLKGAKMQLILEASGEIIKEWITDETGAIQFFGLPAGVYLVKEVEAPEGYQIPEGPMRITVTKDYKQQTFVMENRMTELMIDKLDEETREPVTGAVLQLTDGEGNQVAKWITTGEPELIRGLKAGWYILEEIQAADGYLILKEPVRIEITEKAGIQTVTITNRKLEVEVAKIDKETGENLAGARLQLIRDADGMVLKEWVSGKMPEIFKGLSAGDYTIRELTAPEGYAVTGHLNFCVSGTEEKQEIILVNEKIVVELQKTDTLEGSPVEGAVLQLLKAAGTNEETVMKEWVSGKEPLILTGIPAGIYTIRETQAPEGYVPMEDMKIEILPNQTMQHFDIKNQPIQIEIGKVSGETGKLLGGAVLQLVRDSDGTVIREWTSRDGEAEHFKNLAGGTYIIREVKAPSGYEKMEPQEIEIKDIEAIQEFVVKNYKITHSGGGGGSTPNHPRPSAEYMELFKIDGRTGQKLAGAKITVYNPDGSVYAEGITNSAGTFRFKKPLKGAYTFKETEAPEGYYLNEVLHAFAVTDDGTIEGDTTMENYSKTEMIISKVDVTTAEELPGAEIEVTDQDGNHIFSGISDEKGKVYFPVPSPGEYHFRELTAPEGYDRNETVFSFTVFEDGSIIGDNTITDQKHYGTITASYETNRRGEGDLTVGELNHAPKTGDTSYFVGVFMAWLASVVSLLIVSLSKWRKKQKKSKTGIKAGMFLLLAIMAVSTPVMETQAAEDVIENIYEEHQYTTENPDSNEAEKLFEKEIERDGKKYRLSEIRTEVLEEQGKRNSGNSFEIATNPFLDGKVEVRPEEQITRNGITYHLVKSQKEAAVIRAHEVPVSEEVLYEAVESKDMIPSKIKMTVTDEKTGQMMETIAKISGQTFGGERLDDTFSFSAVFHEYGLDGYWIGDQVFKLSGTEPDFTGYEGQLFSLIEADAEHYTIEAARWDGEAYTDEVGILCRRVVITGTKKVSDCTVMYEGSAYFPEEEGVRLISTYDSGEKGVKQYTMKATGVYIPKKNHGAVVATVIGVTSVGAGTAGYTYYRKKKQNQNV